MEGVNRGGTRLRFALGLTLVILVVELAGGLLSHSLALLSDAGHVLTDVFALGLAWFAIEQSKRPADQRRSDRLRRVGHRSRDGQPFDGGHPTRHQHGRGLV